MTDRERGWNDLMDHWQACRRREGEAAVTGTPEQAAAARAATAEALAMWVEYRERLAADLHLMLRAATATDPDFSLTTVIGEDAARAVSRRTEQWAHLVSRLVQEAGHLRAEVDRLRKRVEQLERAGRQRPPLGVVRKGS